MELVKALLQGMLPAIISTFFDTFLLPLAFYFIAQVGSGDRSPARKCGPASLWGDATPANCPNCLSAV